MKEVSCDFSIDSVAFAFWPQIIAAWFTAPGIITSLFVTALIYDNVAAYVMCIGVS